jgi:glycosyl transferase family 25
MWEFVDKVIYINLDKRTDRDERTREVLSTFGDKVIRLSAIEDENGAIGCIKSHIAALNAAYANKWRNVLIMEDDVEWNDFDNGYKLVESLSRKAYDVIHFGPSAAKIAQYSYRMIDGQTTSSYLVSRHYIPTLVNCFNYGLSKLIKGGNPDAYAADQCWKHLMGSGNWYAAHPCLVYQREDYSDIRKERFDGRHFWAFKV